MKKRLSVVIIAKNEQTLLPDCLASVAWADEIILLDGGSSDNTQDVAAQAGVKVYANSDWQGYGKQRQLAQQHATGDYIFMLDADERVTPELRTSIEQVLISADDSNVYSCPRRNFFLGRFMRHSGWYPDRVIRLYAKDKYRYNNNLVHESLDYGQAQVVALSGDLIHLTCRDFFVFQRKQLRYAEEWAIQRHQQQRRCSITSACLHGFGAFCKTWLLRRGFLDGKQGLLLACVNAQYTFNKYAALWALSNMEEPST